MSIYRFYTLDSEGTRYPAVEVDCEDDVDACAFAAKMSDVRANIIEVWRDNHLVHCHLAHSNLNDRSTLQD